MADRVTVANDSFDYPYLTDAADDIPTEMGDDHILSGLIGSNPGDVTVEHISQPDGMPGMLETIYGPSTVDPESITQLPDVLKEGDAIGLSNEAEEPAWDRVQRMLRQGKGTPTRSVKPNRLSTAQVLIPLASVAVPLLVRGSDVRNYKLTLRVSTVTGLEVVGVDNVQFNALAVRDLLTATGVAVPLVPNAGSQIFINNTLDQPGNYNLQFSRDGGVTWTGIGAPVALGAGSGVAIGVPTGIGLGARLEAPSITHVRLTYAATPTPPGNGTLTMIVQQFPLVGGNNDGVYISSSQAEAAAGVGFPIYQGDEPIVIEAFDDVYAGPLGTNNNSVVLNVLTERWA